MTIGAGPFAPDARGDWGVGYVYAQSWFVHLLKSRPTFLHKLQAVESGQGIFRDRFGGFIDPSCLMIDKLSCSDIIPLWRTPLPGDSREIRRITETN